MRRRAAWTEGCREDEWGTGTVLSTDTWQRGISESERKSATGLQLRLCIMWHGTSRWTGCQTCLIFWRSWVQILALHWRSINWRFTFKIQVVSVFTVRFDSRTPAFCQLCLCVPYDVHYKQLLFPIQHSQTGVNNGGTLCSQLCKNWIFLACVTYINFGIQRLRIIFTNSG